MRLYTPSSGFGGPATSGPTAFQRLAELCERLASTSGRNEKIALVGGFLRGLRKEEIAPAVLLIVGRIFPEAEDRPLEVGFATLSRIPSEGRQKTLLQAPLTILKVYECLVNIASAKGPGSRARKRALLEGLLGQATEVERRWIVKSIFGEMQHGVSEGLMLEAIARAANVEPSLVRRANVLTGDLGRVAFAAMTEGRGGLRKVGVELFRPVKPMLADVSYSLKDVFKEHGGRTALEYKFDGARIQIHKKGDEVRIFSRRLSDVTESLPDVVEVARREVKAEEAILEGEVLAIGRDGRPLPFQDLMRRFRRIRGVEEAMGMVPLKLYLFDVLYLNGEALMDRAYEERWKLIEGVVGGELMAKRRVVSSLEEADEFLREAIAEGHEGLMSKALRSPYIPGRRVKDWLKIKPSETLDLVIVAADWGHGRRTGWLSNYHLAAPDEEGRFWVLGKTFKGLTDDEFREMTDRLMKLKVSETERTVYVKPEVVVEVAYNEIQRSPHYESGLALRFARITRIREDKGPSEADSLRRVKELYERQFIHKARPSGTKA